MANPSSSAKVRTVDEGFQAEPTVEAPHAPTAPAQASDAMPAKAKSKGATKKVVLSLMLIAGLAGGVYYGHDWWVEGRFMVSTDDAYIEGDITNIASKVSGYVAHVDVVANRRVKKGDPLVTLDAGDYRIAVEQADAAIATQKLALARFDAQIEAARASLAQADASKTALQATLRGAEITEQRASKLAANNAGTVADLDNAKVSLDQARANLLGADSAIASAKANIAVVTAQKAEAESEIRSLELSKDKAARDLSFTVIKAPFDGVAGNIAVQDGDFVSAGQKLAALVPVTELYVDANFKETQLAGIHPGAAVTLEVDALGGEILHGEVVSIAPASGSVFSLLPPENATGNFTKVIQRVPVRIRLPKDALESGHLRAGLSVIAEVDSRTGDPTRRLK
ncbi:membrane fusion protein (multidrug efflux system) [Rhizobium sp. SG_E_25_P2]|uniref:HlyD family secretion protein n=1 Tax=Rhizobium sp. SG_E_25_P2 TaxID=2879942 RepID=UPI0024758EB8|nr:HlyD family secretion protein [Rhizobium sp. SG_E_25_P2]MDH6265468.1 membrane fusion protein (multidrug efflux system) [Rhizobium sp. SG_E_25_P2]